MTRIRKHALAGVAAALALATAGVGAQQAAGARPSSLETLKQMKVATTDLNIPTVPRKAPRPISCARTSSA